MLIMVVDMVVGVTVDVVVDMTADIAVDMTADIAVDVVVDAPHAQITFGIRGLWRIWLSFP